MSDRVFKIAAWTYIAALAAASLFHDAWRGALGSPYEIGHLVAFGVAGLTMRLAYPLAPGFACLAMIASVCGFNLIGSLMTGYSQPPLDIIAGMAGALWGVALGATVRSGHARLTRHPRHPV